MFSNTLPTVVGKLILTIQHHLKKLFKFTIYVVISLWCVRLIKYWLPSRNLLLINYLTICTFWYNKTAVIITRYWFQFTYLFPPVPCLELYSTFVVTNPGHRYLSHIWLQSSSWCLTPLTLNTKAYCRRVVNATFCTFISLYSCWVPVIKIMFARYLIYIF